MPIEKCQIMKLRESFEDILIILKRQLLILHVRLLTTADLVFFTRVFSPDFNEHTCNMENYSGKGGQKAKRRLCLPFSVTNPPGTYGITKNIKNFLLRFLVD